VPVTKTTKPADISNSWDMRDTERTDDRRDSSLVGGRGGIMFAGDTTMNEDKLYGSSHKRQQNNRYVS